MPRKPKPLSAPMINDDALTDMQRAFVDAYITNGFNGGRAAIAAGYSPLSAYAEASRQLRNVKVRELIDAYFAEQAMGPREVISRLTSIGRGDLGDLYNEDTGQVDWKKVRAAGLSYLIKKIDHKTTRTTAVNAKGEETDIEVFEDRIELHDPMKALQLVGKQLGLFVEKSETKISGELSVKSYKGFTPEEWDDDPSADS